MTFEAFEPSEIDQRLKGSHDSHSLYEYTQCADGIFEFENTNRYVQWFSPKWKCNTNSVGPFGGDDAIDINISNDAQLNGAWCDMQKSQLRKFICEALI